MRPSNHWSTRSLGGAIVLCILQGPASAAGFALNEHSARYLGNALAGASAISDDASTVYFNPAGMTELPSQFMFSGHAVVPNIDVTGSATQGGAPISGAGSDAGTLGAVANMYWVHRINERTSVGAGIGTPFGLATEYDDDWAGRFHAIRSELLTLNLNPSIAHKLSDQLSIGFGVNVQYLHAKINNAINFGVAEGFIENEADDVSYGYNGGVLFKPAPGTKIGLSYRSRIAHELKGDVRFNIPAAVAGVPFGTFNPTVPAPFASMPTSTFFQNDNITVDIELPATASISAYHRFANSKFALMGDATWTEWSNLPELRIVFDSPLTTLGPAVEEFGWENTWRFSTGVNYYHNDVWTFRAGTAYDESPVPDNTMRTPRLPDSDRIWATLGATYEMSDHLSFDVGYLFGYGKKNSINRTNSSGAVLRATVEPRVHVLSAQISYRF